MSAGDWALLFGAMIAIAQSLAIQVRHRSHRRRVAAWETETGEQVERLVRAVRLCRQAERRCTHRVSVLERRLASIEEFHGEGRCQPLPDDWEPPGEPGWPYDPGRWQP